MFDYFTYELLFLPSLFSSHPYPSVMGPHLLCRTLFNLASNTYIAIDTLPVRGSVAGLLSEVARVVCVE